MRTRIAAINVIGCEAADEQIHSRSVFSHQQISQMAVRHELVFDECGDASRRRRQAHAFLIDRLTKLIKKRENESAAKTGFALTRLQSPVFTAARFYHIFSFPLPPLFFFFGEAIVARFLAQVNGRKIVA